MFSVKTKLLVGLGSTEDGFTDSIEIIDLSSPNTTCKNLPNFPQTLEKPFGGLGFQDRPNICGTEDDTYNQTNKCYSLEGKEWTYLSGLNISRAWEEDSPSLYQSLSQAFLRSRSGDLNTTTEDLTEQDWEETMPQSIPFTFNAFCSVLVNSTTALVIGSLPMHTSSGTFYINLETEVWTEGPFLKNIRESSSCGKIRKNNSSQDLSIIVVGGWSNWQLASVEILDQDAEEWRNGPDLPLEMYNAKMVEDQNGGVFLVGGHSNGVGPLDTLFQLPHGGADAEWTKMQQKLKVGRSAHVAFLLPDSIVECS